MSLVRPIERWLQSKSHEDWGFAYCKGDRDGKLILSYVDIPDVAEHEVLVSPSDVIFRPIPVGTRVWVRGRPFGWHAGVIERSAPNHRYRVSFVNHSGAPWQLELGQDQFSIRWSRPLEDPTAAIAHGLVESPIFYDARSDLLAELVQQRALCCGLSAAISAPINLFQHQVDTAARVLADPVMRYLLADEVGLGKTIEAGLVIRQIAIDDPSAKVLVMCPESLVGQWQSELKYRLGLDTALRDGFLKVVPHHVVRNIALGLQSGLADYDLVVVDEAHNLFRHFEGDLELEAQFSKLSALIALSATPMRGDLETFRRLLALVDPVAFGGVDPQSFLQRINERERSAADVQVLATRQASLRQKTAALESIVSDYPEDENVLGLAEACRSSEDPKDQAWADLSDYVREIYRISRRMIRHRRTDELTRSYVVSGRTPTFVEFEDPARVVIDEFLESYRIRLNRTDPTFASTVLHALAGPMALRDYLRDRLHEEDGALFEMTIARLEMAGLNARLAAAAAVTTELIYDSGYRVVVVSSHPAVLAAFKDLLAEYVDGEIIHCHYLSMPPGRRDDAVARFLNSEDGAALLADHSMEEGRNLQEAEALINLDLPLDPNQLDQRIGRLDRYAARSTPAEVVVLTEPSSPWVSAHVEFLRNGIGVFDDSISTVQRLLWKVLGDVTADLVELGVDALNVDVASLRDQLEAERESIDLLEELESVESATVFHDEAFEELLDYEADLGHLREGLRRLTTGKGSIALEPVESSSGILTFGTAHGVGLAVDDAASLEQLLSPKVFDRNDALKQQGVTPFRIGDPLVEWLHDYLLADERGRSFAFVRSHPDVTLPTLWFHSEFLVEFDAEQSSIPEGPDRARLARRGEGHLQPLRFETWTDASGPAPQDIVDNVLDLPFDPVRDEVLRGDAWTPVLEGLPAWRTLCDESAAAAWDQVRGSEQLEDTLRVAAESAAVDSERRIAILQARSVRLPSGLERDAARMELESEQVASEALANGIGTPSIRLVACGACVVVPEATS